MLICILYQHFTDRKDEELMFDDVDVDEKRKTKDERRKTSIEKEQKKKECYFKTKCVRRDGALLGAASAYFLPSSQHS